MAYVKPVNRSLAELINPAIWNQDVVANMLAMGPHLHARKTAIQSVTSSTAFVDDDTIQFPVAASEVWQFRFFIRYDASTTGDLKVSFSLPTSGEIEASAFPPSGTAGAYQDVSWQSLTTTDSQPLAFPGAGSGTIRPLIIDGVYVGAGTAGTMKLRWAQNTSDATATRVHPHSTVWIAQLV